MVFISMWYQKIQKEVDWKVVNGSMDKKGQCSENLRGSRVGAGGPLSGKSQMTLGLLRNTGRYPLEKQLDPNNPIVSRSVKYIND